MLEIYKTEELAARKIPFGALEVRYPPRAEWDAAAFRALVESELEAEREKFAGYDRKVVFGEDRYFRFFRKFKKTYPVMLQFESIVVKGLPFPHGNGVTDVPYLFELTTRMLSGTHDMRFVDGALCLSSGVDRTSFPGIHGSEKHTYPGDVVGRDGTGIIFSEISGADERTCAKPDSTHVFYPVFGTPDMPISDIESALAELRRLALVLAPGAETEAIIV